MKKSFKTKLDMTIDGYKELIKHSVTKINEAKDLKELERIASDFLKNCYDLKDWIKNDDELKYSRMQKEDLEEFISGSEFFGHKIMLYLANIADACKHLKLDKDRWTRRRCIEDIEIGGFRIGGKDEAENSGWFLCVYSNMEREMYEMKLLAKWLLLQWRKYFEENSFGKYVLVKFDFLKEGKLNIVRSTVTNIRRKPNGKLCRLHREAK